MRASSGRWGRPPSDLRRAPHAALRTFRRDARARWMPRPVRGGRGPASRCAPGSTASAARREARRGRARDRRRCRAPPRRGSRFAVAMAPAPSRRQASAAAHPTPFAKARAPIRKRRARQGRIGAGSRAERPRTARRSETAPTPRPLRGLAWRAPGRGLPSPPAVPRPRGAPPARPPRRFASDPRRDEGRADHPARAHRRGPWERAEAALTLTPPVGR